MSIFYISAFNEPEATKLALESGSLSHTLSYIQTHDGQWFVSFKGTSKELSDLLGIPGNNGGQTGVIVAVSGYYGFAPNDVWEFVAAHWND